MLHKPLRYPGNSVYTMVKPGPLIVYVMHPHNQGFIQPLEGCAPHALTGYHPWLLPLLPSHPPPVWLDEGSTEGMSAATDELSPPAAALCCPSFFLAFLTFVFFALSTFPCCERRLPPGPCKNIEKHKEHAPNCLSSLVGLDWARLAAISWPGPAGCGHVSV